MIIMLVLFCLILFGDEALESALAAYFAPNCIIHFSNKRSTISLRQLESEIQGFIADNLLDKKAELIESTIISDRKKYISFKIMDMIYLLNSGKSLSQTPEAKEQVHKIEAKFEDTASNFTFFCLSFGNEVLVLQFMRPDNNHSASNP